MWGMLPQVKLGACSEIDSESIFGQKQSCMYSTYMVHSPVLAAVYGPYGRLVTYYKKLEGLIMFSQNTQYIQLH